MADGALREVLAAFSIDVDDAKLEALEKKLAVVSDKLSTFGQVAKDYGAVLGAGAAFWGLNKFVSSNAAAAGEISKLSNRLGMSLEDVQKFGYAAKMSGMDMDEAGNALKFLNKNMADAKGGGKETSEAFAKLGVKVTDSAGNMRPAMEIMPELADGISKLKSPADQTALAMKVFGRGGLAMVPLLKKGSAGIKEMGLEFDDLGVRVSDADLGALSAYRKSVKKVAAVSASLGMTMAARLAPAFTWIQTKVLGVIAPFNHFIQTTNIVQAVLIGIGAVALYQTVPALMKLSTAIGGLITANPGVALTVGILLLFALALEDIYTFANGGKSLTGDWLTSWLGAETAQKDAKELKAILDDLSKTLHSFGVDSVGDIVGGVVRAVSEGLKFLAAGLADVAYAAVQAVHGNLEPMGHLGKSLGDRADKAGDAIFKPNGDQNVTQANGAQVRRETSGVALPGGVPKAPDAPFSMVPMAAQAPGGGAPPPWWGGSAAAPPVNQTNQITVNVQGGANPAETGKVVAGAVATEQKKNQAALAAVSTGGR